MPSPTRDRDLDPDDARRELVRLRESIDYTYRLIEDSKRLADDCRALLARMAASGQ